MVLGPGCFYLQAIKITAIFRTPVKDQNLHPLPERVASGMQSDFSLS
jgi:hypothetical protein